MIGLQTAALDDGGHFVFPREWATTAAIPRVTRTQLALLFERRAEA